MLTPNSIFIVAYVGWKMIQKTKMVAIHEIDLYTGRVNDAENLDLEAEQGKFRNALHKISSKVF